MSQSYFIRDPVRAGSIVAVGRIVLSGWAGNIVLWLGRRRQWQHLSELDDRLLADVGISPEDAFRKAGRPLHGKSLVVLESVHMS